MRMRIIVEFEIGGPDADTAGDTINNALDAGTIQDAIEDAREIEELDFTIEQATVIGETRVR